MNEPENCPTCGKRAKYGTPSAVQGGTKEEYRCENGHHWEVTYKLDRQSGTYVPERLIDF